MDKEFAWSFMEYPRSGNLWMDFNPMTKFIICFCVALASVFIYNWHYAAVQIIVMLIFCAVIGQGKKFAKMLLGVGGLLLLFTVLIRQIGYREINHTVMFSIGSWKWYRESFEAALNIVGYMVGFAGAMLIFFNTADMRDIMYTLETKGVGHETSYIMLSSMQSIIDMKKSANTIIESQKARGIETDGNALVRAKAFFPTLGPIMLSSMSGTEEKSIAMEARAFSHKGQQTYLRELRPATGLEKVLDVIAVIYLLLSIAYRIMLEVMP